MSNCLMESHMSMTLKRALIFNATKAMFKAALAPLCSVEVVNRHKLPTRGPCYLACNHQSYLDGFLIFSIAWAPMSILADSIYYNWPVFKQICQANQVIPVAPAKLSPEILARAYELISQVIRGGGIVSLFPEGFVTRDGEVAEFKEGIQRVIQRDPAPVIPMALHGLWGSPFSLSGGKVLFKRPDSLRPSVRFNVGDPIPPQRVTASGLREEVMRLKQELIRDHA